MVDDGASSASRRCRRIPEKDQHIRKLDDLEVVRADFRGDTAKRIDVKLLCRLDIGRAQVMVTVDDWSFACSRPLGCGGPGHSEEHAQRHKNDECLHGAQVYIKVDLRTGCDRACLEHWKEVAWRTARSTISVSRETIRRFWNPRA